MKKKAMPRWLGGAAGALVVLAILVLLNVLLGTLRLRKDLTADKLYTLSGGTRQLLAELERPVTLKFYFSRSSEQVPAPVKHYARRIADLLKEYEAAGRGRVILEKHDPRPDSEEEEWAQRYGLVGQPLGYRGEDDMYLGLVGMSGTREAALPFLAPAMEPQLEYLVTRLILEVTRESTSRIGLITSLPLQGTPPMPFGGREPDPEWIVHRQLSGEHEVIHVDSDARNIDPSLDALLMVHPGELPPALLYAVDQYLLRGGRLLAFVDPFCLAEQETMPQAGQHAFMMGGNASHLNALTEAWGMRMEEGMVVADPRAATRVSGPGGRPQNLPTWLSLRPGQMNREDIATASLNDLMLPFAGVFSGQPAEGLTGTVLLSTSEDAVLLDSFMAMNPSLEALHGARRAGSQPMAIRLQGRFATAFPDGPPTANEDDGPADAEGNHLAAGVRDGVAVLVGNVDLLYDRFAAQEMHFLGHSFVEPVNDNLAFVLNLVEQVSGDEALIGLRSRGTFNRPFDRVVEIENRARQRWQAEELKLMEELRETQERLRALQRVGEQEDQQFILSPEQQSEIEAFRERRFETQQRLTEVRRNLRADIERLGMKVKIINLAAMPALVALFGVAYGWRRRRNALRRPADPKSNADGRD